MFMPIKFNTTIILTPSEMTASFDSIVFNKVRSTLENCCSKHGYIKKDSIKIIKRSAGYFKESHLNGNIASTQIYNRALSATEVLQNFNATRGRYGI